MATITEIEISRVGPAGALDMSTVTLATGAPGSDVTYEGGVLSIPRGDTGGLSDEDRARVDGAITAAGNLDAAMGEVNAAAGAAAGSASAAAGAATGAAGSAASAASAADTAGQSATAAGQSEAEAKAARDAVLNMQVATGAAGSSVTWDGTTLSVPRGANGQSVTVLAFEASDTAGYNNAVAIHAGNPLVWVIRYAS